MRRLAEAGEPAVTVRLVNWADEEGARFGRSLFGSSAASGTMADQDELRELADKDGNPLPDTLRAHGVELDRALDAHAQLGTAGAYLELHIEQGPVLEDLGLPLGVVLGTYGVQRHAVRFTGQSAHAGSTPMDRRRDALAAAAKLALEIRPIAIAARRRLHRRPGRDEARDRDRGRRGVRDPARPAAPRRGHARRDAGRGEGARASASPPRRTSRSSGSGSGRSSRSCSIPS